MATNIALDTNILIYLHDSSSPNKRTIAGNLLADGPFISSQVISEYLNTTRRLLDLPKDELLLRSAGLFSGCTIFPLTTDTLTLAAVLTKRYKFQLFDAVIVASAIEANCEILYTEDMQNNLIVDKKIRIINPFIKR